MNYSLDERETLIHYDEAEKHWLIESNVPKHIRKFMKACRPDSIKTEKDDSGRIVSFSGVLDEEGFYVSVSKKAAKREYTQEEREAMAERLRKYRKQ